MTKAGRRSGQAGLAAVLVLALASLLPGCSLPREGALRSELDRGADGQVRVQPIDTALVARSVAIPPAGLPDELRSLAPYMVGRIAPGDQLALTIIESGGAGAPTVTGGRLDMTDVRVDAAGTLAIPFAGPVPVAGLDTADARAAIEARLRRSLLRPQVQLQLLDRPERNVSVVGAVGKGGAWPLSPSLLRLADLLGAAGVDDTRAGQVRIDLRRNGETASLTLEQLLSDAADNIALRPGDVVTVSRVPQHVTVMGAVSTPGRLEIADARYSLLDAVADARGLDGASANPSGIFLFPQAEREGADGRPAIYSIDIRDPQQVLLARDLRLADGDLVYVSATGFGTTVKILDTISRALLSVTRLPDL